MRIYRNDDMTAAEQWAGTQDEANKRFGRGQWSQVDVPTDKAGLIAFLEALVDRRAHVPECPPIMSRDEQLDRGFNLAGELELTDVEEFIQAADPSRLASLASNVCYRMAELARGLT